MARIRSIKPEFFTSEDIVSLSPLARLLYIALWCEADREGRLAWKPKTFKMRYLPGDRCDIEAVAGELLSARLVVRYGEGLAFIPSFLRHQHINPRESASQLPVPDASARVTDAQVGREGKEGEGKEGKGGGEPPPCPQQAVVDLYHEVLPTLRRVRDWNEDRQGFLRARWRESPDRQTLDWWRNYFAYVSGSDFLMGRKTGGNGRPFDCDLEWLVRPTNFVKVIEGKYENG